MNIQIFMFIKIGLFLFEFLLLFQFVLTQMAYLGLDHLVAVPSYKLRNVINIFVMNVSLLILLLVFILYWSP